MEVLLVAMILLFLAVPAGRSASEPAGAAEPSLPRPRPLPKVRRLASERAAEAATHRRRLDWLAEERAGAGGDPDALRRIEGLEAAEAARHAEKLRRLASEEVDA